MFRQVDTVNSLSDMGSTLDLVRKAVLAAKVDGLQQDCLGGGDVTTGGEHVGVGDALDNVPLRCGRGVVPSFTGQVQGCCVIARVEEAP